MAHNQMEIFRYTVLEAKHVDNNMISLEIERETDEIMSVVDSEFVDFIDAQVL
jgi:hypothetical protein